MLRSTGGAAAGRQFGLDIGGTFTDLVVEEADGSLRFYKRPSTPEDPVKAVADVLIAAATDMTLSVRELLEQGETFVHGTTRATNAIVTKQTARTAFLTTRGHRDILLLREGGEREDPFDYSRPYPPPYVPRHLTFEVVERIWSDGSIHVPLDEDAVAATLVGLSGEGIESIAVCLLWSIVNPVHELRVAALIDALVPAIPYTLSHQLNPALPEYRRAMSTAINASLQPVMRGYIDGIESYLRIEGFHGRFLMLLGSGGVADPATVAESPIHLINCGPAAAPVAGRHFAARDADADGAIVTDAGGTTFDVSLVRRGKLPWTREARIGDPSLAYVTGFPAVDIRSVGAGGGSIASVDVAGLLHVGPESAGAAPGPACYGKGGTKATVTDACLVLGYIDPAYYLGGSIVLSVERAMEAVTLCVADPLGLDVHEAAAAVLDLACERMATLIEDIAVMQGLDPTEAAMIAGGGGAGLYAVPIARRLGAPSVVIPHLAATLSAAGALMSDLQATYAATYFTTSDCFDFDGVNPVLASLENRAKVFTQDPRSREADHEITFTVDARYPGQIHTLEVPLRASRVRVQADVECLRRDFHELHAELFAHSADASGLEFTTWRAFARCALRPDGRSLGDNGPVGAARARPAAPPHGTAGQRPAFFTPSGHVATAVHRVDAMRPGSRVRGPALLETALQTVVLPPDARAELLPSGSLRLETQDTRRQQAAGTRAAATVAVLGEGE